MANEDGPLIDLIRQYPWLYDKQEKQYRNKNAKQNAWQMIANILKTNPEDCEQRWIVLRNRFCTELRNMKTRPSGSGATTSSWHLFEAMSFLSDFIIPRKSRGNFARPPQKHQTQADVNHVDIWDSYSTIIYNNQSQDSEQQSSDVEMSTQETEGTSSTASSSTTQHNLPSCSGIQTKNNQKRKASEDGDVITKETEGTTHQNVPSCSGVQMNNDQRMKVNEKRKVMTDIENTSNQFIKDKKKKKSRNEIAELGSALQGAPTEFSQYMHTKNENVQPKPPQEPESQDELFGKLIAGYLSEIQEVREKRLVKSKILELFNEY